MHHTDEVPVILEDFLNYSETIKGKSPHTVKEYGYDLKTFFKFIKIRFNIVPQNTNFDNIYIANIDESLISKITLNDLHAYISFVDKKRNNSNSTKARKVASTKSFFKYLISIRQVIDFNPAAELEAPKLGNKHPNYLTLSESRSLLESIEGKYKERDFAIITLFLNCGLRLSELESIDIDKIRDDTLSVLGKGNKERTIYLNNSCLDAISSYLKIRPTDNLKDPKALFISRHRARLNRKTIQSLVKKHLRNSGLDDKKYSTHDLRHTAATLMYKYGDVDIRTLQQILGHENVSTTQIYTHLDDDILRKAVSKNPLSK